MSYDDPLGLIWTPEMQAVEQQLRWWKEAEWPFGPVWAATEWVLAGLHTGMDKTIRDVAERMIRNGDYVLEVEEMCRRVETAVTILKSADPIELLRTADD
jgi:hypothetical protein